VFETTLDCVRSNRLEPTQDVLKVMLKSADVLADLTNAARDGGYVDEARSRGLVKELEALASGEMLAGPAKSPEPAPAAAKPAAASPDDSGFQPIPFSFDAFDDGEGAEEKQSYGIAFRARRELYSKGNETALLLRDLTRLGEMSITCDTDALPLLEKMDPEESYFCWTIVLKTEKSEDDIRAVFEFAEWDCELDIKAVPSLPLAENMPMIPVPFDLAALDDSFSGTQPEKAAAEPAVAAADAAT